MRDTFIRIASLMIVAAACTEPDPSDVEAALTGTTYYVSVAGSDGNSGSAAAPFRHLSKAAAVASQPGDTVVVMDGTYDNEGVVSPNYVVTLQHSGAAGQPITFMAQHRGKAILDAMNTRTDTTCNGAYSYFNLSHASFVVIQGFVIQRACDEGIHSNDNAHDIVIRWNEIRNIANHTVTDQIGRDGIYLNQSEANFTFDGNIFHDIGRTGGVSLNHFDHGVYLHATNVKIINNIFYNMTSGYSIQLADAANGVLIANNTFAFPNHPQTGEDGQIIFWGSNTNLTVRDNVFYRPHNNALARYQASVSGVVDHNLVYGATGMIGDSSGLTVGTNVIGQDPQFRNAPSDFHLQATSPALTAGANLSALFVDDLDNTTRPSSGAWTAGAYAAGGGTTTTGPVATFSPTTLAFSNQTVGTTSGVQYITLTNTGTATLHLTNVVFAGDFAPAGLGTCGVASPVATGASCTISVVFTPASAGTRTGSITVSDDAPNSPQVLTLSGTGGSTSQPVIALSATSLVFPSQTVGTTSAVQYITVSNTGTASMTLGAPSISGADFAFAGLGTCASALAAGSSCTYSVMFTPTMAGTRTGVVTINDNAGGPHSVSLTGVGGAANLLQNAGFESGLSAWIDWGNTAVVTSPAHGGSYALRVGTGTGGVGQNLTGLTPGATYTVTAYAYMDAPTAQWASVQVAYQTAGGADIAGYVYTAHITSASWAQYSLSATAPSSFDHVQVRIWNNAGSSYVYLDDVTLH